MGMKLSWIKGLFLGGAVMAVAGCGSAPKTDDRTFVADDHAFADDQAADLVMTAEQRVNLDRTLADAKAELTRFRLKTEIEDYTETSWLTADPMVLSERVLPDALLFCMSKPELWIHAEYLVKQRGLEFTPDDILAAGEIFAHIIVTRDPKKSVLNTLLVDAYFDLCVRKGGVDLLNRAFGHMVGKIVQSDITDADKAEILYISQKFVDHGGDSDEAEKWSKKFIEETFPQQFAKMMEDALRRTLEEEALNRALRESRQPTPPPDRSR